MLIQRPRDRRNKYYEQPEKRTEINQYSQHGAGTLLLEIITHAQCNGGIFLELKRKHFGMLVAGLPAHCTNSSKNQQTNRKKSYTLLLSLNKRKWPN